MIENNAILSNTGRGDSTWSDQFTRGLAYFARDNNLWGLYYSGMATNANAAWNARRTDLNITWNAWASPTATDGSSSMECLSAAVIQQVLPPTTSGAPIFTVQPASKITALGNAVTLNSLATNGQSITYQWYYENNPIPGASGTNLVLLSVATNNAGQYWVLASNSMAAAYSQVASIYLIGNANGIIGQDAATNYNSTIGFTGNQGFGFGPWVLSTVGGGCYISGDTPPLFGIWNNTAKSQSTASRAFNLPLPIGSSFLVQLEMTTLDTAANQNGFELQDDNGNTLFSYWHQGGDSSNGHYTDANGSGTALGFAYNGGQVDSFKFTLTSPTTYTFSDLTTAKSFSGKLSGAAISEVTLYRTNGAYTPSSGDDFKFSNLAIMVVPVTPSPSAIAVEKTLQGWSLSFPVAPGYSYCVQRATSLAGPWTNVGTLTGPATGMAEFIDTNPPSPQSFYRTVSP